MSTVTRALEAQEKYNWPTALKEFHIYSNDGVVKWADLRKNWLKKGNIPLESYKGITGEQIKKLRNDKVKKYHEEVNRLVKVTISHYPSGVFDDEESIYEAAHAETLKQFTKAYISPTIWGQSYIEADGNIRIGPAFLRGLKHNDIMKTDKASNGNLMGNIKGAIRAEMRKSDKLSVHFRGKVTEIKNFIGNYQQEFDSIPDESTISKKLKMKPDLVRQYMSLMNLYDISYDGAKATINNFTDDTFMDPEFITLAADELQKSWKHGTKNMSGQQKLVISLYLFEDLELREIAEVVGESEDDIKEVFVESSKILDKELRLNFFGGMQF